MEAAHPPLGAEPGLEASALAPGSQRTSLPWTNPMTGLEIKPTDFGGRGAGSFGL